VIARALLTLSALAVSAGPAAGEHLLAGAGAFREGKFDAALVEFRVAEKLGAPEAGAYAGAALVKLGRAEEAVEAFASSPPGDDELLDWYRAVACYDAKLYGCAERALAGLDRAGPKVAAEVARLRGEIARVLSPQPAPASVDWYQARCEARYGEGRAALGAAYCREAAELGGRRPDRHGVARANGVLVRFEPASLPGSKR
jgi:hypothetical protein